MYVYILYGTGREFVPRGVVGIASHRTCVADDNDNDDNDDIKVHPHRSGAAHKYVIEGFVRADA